MATVTHSAAAVLQQIAEVEDLQKRIRAVILDDSLERLEPMMDEKRSRLAGLRLDQLQPSEVSAISNRLQAIWQTESELEELVRSRMLLMRNQLRKASEAGRALRGYGLGTNTLRGVDRHSRDICG